MKKLVIFTLTIIFLFLITSCGGGLNRPPLVPHDPNPADNSTGVPINLTLTWQCGDPDGDVLFYDVYLSDTYPPTFYKRTSLEFVKPEGLKAGTRYYWKVVANDGRASTESLIWSFTTQSTPSQTLRIDSVPLGIFILVDNVQHLTPFFQSLPKGSHSIQVPSPQFKDTSDYVEGTDTKYSFSHWSDGSTNNPRTISLNKDTSLKAFMDVEYKVIFKSQGNGSIRHEERMTPLTQQDEFYPKGTTLHLTAQPSPNNEFVQWKINGNVMLSNSIDVQVDEPMEVVAEFRQITPNHPPNPPHDPYPEDGESGVPTGVELRWECEDKDGDELSYDLYLDTVDPPQKKIAERIRENRFYVELEEGERYYWKVVAYDGKEEREGSVWEFETVRPEMVELLVKTDIEGLKVKIDGIEYESPASKMVKRGSEHEIGVVSPQYSEDRSIEYVFKIWGDGEESKDRIVKVEEDEEYEAMMRKKYRVKFDIVHGRGKMMDDVNNEELPEEGYYYAGSRIRVRAEGEEGYGFYRWREEKRAWSGENPFEIEIDKAKEIEVEFNGLPEIPSKPDPRDGETGVATRGVVLRWNECKDEEDTPITYDVYFSSKNPPEKMVCEGSTKTECELGQLEYSRRYYWKVVARDSKGGEREGPIWHFDTEGTPLVELNVDSTPIKVEVRIDGIWKETAWGTIVYENSVHEIEARSPVRVNESEWVEGEDAEYEFEEWMEDGNRDNPREVEVEGDSTYTAKMVLRRCKIEVEKEGEGEVSIGEGWYGAGVEEELAATPNEGSVFYEWEINGEIVKENPTEVKIDEPKKVVAIFNKLPRKPENEWPSDGAQGINTDGVELRWVSGDEDGDELRYDVYFGTDENDLEKVSSDQEEARYYTGELEADETYYWMIVVKDTRGGVATSDVWSFRTMEGKYLAVAGWNEGLIVFEIDKDPEEPEIKSVMGTEGEVHDVYVDRGYAYVADGKNGLLIVDISDPRKPMVVGHYDGAKVYGVYADGGYAYVTSDYYDLIVLDVRNPEEPEVTGEIAVGEWGAPCGGIYVAGGYAYVADGENGLLIIDVSDPRNLRLVKNYIYDSSVETCDVYISGGYAYVADGTNGLLIIDVNDPENPHKVGGYTTSAFSVYVSNDRAYVVGDTGLIVLDVSDVENVMEIKRYTDLKSSIDVHVFNEYAYVTRGVFGFAVVNTYTDEIRYIDTGLETWNVFVSGDYAYIADTIESDDPEEAAQTGPIIVDIKNPEDPRVVSKMKTPGWTTDIFVQGNYMYVCDYGNALLIVDVSDPENPNVLSSFDEASKCFGIYVSGNYAYLVGEDGLIIVNVSEPTNPVKEGEYPEGEYYFDVYVLENHAYVGSENGLKVFDVSDPSSPTKVGEYNSSNEVYGVYVVGDYAYIANTSQGLKIIDVSDPANPTYKSRINTDGAAYDVFVSNKYAYVINNIDNLGDLVIVNVEDPANPYIVSHYDLDTFAFGAHVHENHAYIANTWNGLIILNVTDPQNPKLTNDMLWMNFTGLNRF